MESKISEIFIPGPAGRLEAKYFKSKKSTSPIALILHPHPQYGGTMNNKVVVDTFNIFKSKYSDRVKLQSNTYNKTNLRQTTLEDAIIDLFMCIFAKDFKGSYWSSFSSQISNIRRVMENK